MKYIRKGSGPRELRQWFRTLPLNENGKPINCRYDDDIYQDLKEKIIKALLEEQGYLCCYTGIRISEENTHIEHLKPQSISQQDENDHDDVMYSNMLAAYPKGDCQFGAQARGDWYELDFFIHPLDGSCETKFHFDMEGGIKPVSQTDLAAKKTIAHLKLAHPLLVDLRKQAIDELLFPEDEVLSEAKLRRIVENGYSIRDKKGRYPHFCFIIEQVARQLLHKVEQDRKRRQAIHKQKRK
ncbi:retron system putative HNH endonuclease [Allocoleopsis franciscana]|uniref:TIGR02646 family protein n=1 Tax=Allocoleopsis franciscana PCC 7113 TaxID=1173027 RepID=K9WKZ4_9CYAN|nr:retron system putative HNH endonuclease [Allocoleopsis franciscana]AFZ20486.1 TIGR02646 family protein [Allocoleopsis franciscana PCC 7113]